MSRRGDRSSALAAIDSGSDTDHGDGDGGRSNDSRRDPSAPNKVSAKVSDGTLDPQEGVMVQFIVSGRRFDCDLALLRERWPESQWRRFADAEYKRQRERGDRGDVIVRYPYDSDPFAVLHHCLQTHSLLVPPDEAKQAMLYEHAVMYEIAPVVAQLHPLRRAAAKAGPLVASPPPQPPAPPPPPPPPPARPFGRRGRVSRAKRDEADTEPETAEDEAAALAANTVEAPPSTRRPTPVGDYVYPSIARTARISFESKVEHIRETSAWRFSVPVQVLDPSAGRVEPGSALAEAAQAVRKADAAIAAAEMCARAALAAKHETAADEWCDAGHVSVLLGAPLPATVTASATAATSEAFTLSVGTATLAPAAASAPVPTPFPAPAPASVAHEATPDGRAAAAAASAGVADTWADAKMRAAVEAAYRLLRSHGSQLSGMAAKAAAEAPGRARAQGGGSAAAPSARSETKSVVTEGVQKAVQTMAEWREQWDALTLGVLDISGLPMVVAGGSVLACCLAWPASDALLDAALERATNPLAASASAKTRADRQVRLQAAYVVKRRALARVLRRAPIDMTLTGKGPAGSGAELAVPATATPTLGVDASVLARLRAHVVQTWQRFSPDDCDEDDAMDMMRGIDMSPRRLHDPDRDALMKRLVQVEAQLRAALPPRLVAERKRAPAPPPKWTLAERDARMLSRVMWTHGASVMFTEVRDADESDSDSDDPEPGTTEADTKRSASKSHRRSRKGSRSRSRSGSPVRSRSRSPVGPVRRASNSVKVGDVDTTKTETDADDMHREDCAETKAAIEIRCHWQRRARMRGVDREDKTCAPGYRVDPEMWRGADIDLFLVTTDADVALDAIVQLYKRLRRAVPAGHEILIERLEHAVTFVLPPPLRRVQVVLRLYSSPAQVLLGFDLDCCCLLYDGARVLASERGRRALRLRYNLHDASRMSLSYEHRLAKYARRGFPVALPDLEPERHLAAIARLYETPAVPKGWRPLGLTLLLGLLCPEHCRPPFDGKAFDWAEAWIKVAPRWRTTDYGGDERWLYVHVGGRWRWAKKAPRESRFNRVVAVDNVAQVLTTNVSVLSSRGHTGRFARAAPELVRRLPERLAFLAVQPHRQDRRDALFGGAFQPIDGDFYEDGLECVNSPSISSAVADVDRAVENAAANATATATAGDGDSTAASTKSVAPADADEVDADDLDREPNVGIFVGMASGYAAARAASDRARRVARPRRPASRKHAKSRLGRTLGPRQARL